MKQNLNSENNRNDFIFDVIIIGGSFSGLSAAMALGRSLQKVLILDSEKPCNIQTPHSHNFLTQDGKTPKSILENARLQVLNYKTVLLKTAKVVSAKNEQFRFTIKADSGEVFFAKKLIFATGLKDIMPKIEGFSECWGISILHCPYCHGYEVKNLNTGIISNGDIGFEFSKLITNWTKSVTIFTNGKSTFSKEQLAAIQKHNINVVEKVISKVIHTNGTVEAIVFEDKSTAPIEAIYAKIDYEQHCELPQKLGCEINEQGLLKVDNFQKTTVPGIYACGDNSTMRSLAMAVSSGSMAGVMVNKDLIFEAF
jgi:thioredoxin reductase